MKVLWLHLVRGYLRLGLFFYYRRFLVKHQALVPKTGPVLFLSNHNNALMDALLIATRSGRFSYFLTRASVFKSPRVTAFLKSLNMLPVYRIRDGWSSIQKNNAIFEYCTHLMRHGKAIALFPEGNHNIKRTVRPLSKGFTRIIFDTLDAFPETQIHIVPIGINYQKAHVFGDSVTMVLGKPLFAMDYHGGDRHADTLRLKDAAFNSIRTLTTHIPPELYADYDYRLARLQANFLEPEAVNACMASNFTHCHFSKTRKPILIKPLCKYVMLVCLCLPYAVWKLLVLPRIQELEFVATFRFALVITLVPLWMLGLTLLFGIFLGLPYALAYLGFTLLVSLLAVKL